MELLTAIALLCQIHAGSAAAYQVQEKQDACQKQLVKCVMEDKTSHSDVSSLLHCIRDR